MPRGTRHCRACRWLARMRARWRAGLERAFHNACRRQGGGERRLLSPPPWKARRTPMLGLWLLPRAALRLAALLPNARVELVALPRLRALTALAPYTGVEIGTMLAAYGITALLADTRIEVASILGA